MGVLKEEKATMSEDFSVAIVEVFKSIAREQHPAAYAAVKTIGSEVLTSIALTCNAFHESGFPVRCVLAYLNGFYKEAAGDVEDELVSWAMGVMGAAAHVQIYGEYKEHVLDDQADGQTLCGAKVRDGVVVDGDDGDLGMPVEGLCDPENVSKTCPRCVREYVLREAEEGS